MNRKLCFLVIIIIGLSVHYTFAQNPVVNTTIDKSNILIGEQLIYNVQATFPSNSYHVTWFNVPDSFSHFEVVIRGKIDTAENNGILSLRQQLTLTSFDSGINTIPALAINFEPVSGTTPTALYTDSFPVNVSFSPMDTTQALHDIKTIIEVKNEIPLWMWIGGAALIILITVLLIYLVRYFKSKKKSVTLYNSKLTPLEEAIQSLNALQQQQLLQKGEIKHFHTKLTDTFKRYLSRKTQNDVLNLTSSEVLLLLNETLLSKIDTSLAAGSLRMTDAVKFAKYKPPASESEMALNNTKKVIEQIDRLIFTDQNLK